MPDGAPEVLLDQAVRQVRQRLALVVGARDASGERGGEGGQRLRLAEVGLPVANANLDGREAEVRPDAPPELCGLGHRARGVEEADVLLVLAPGGEGVRDAAAREEAREDLRPRGVQEGEDVLDERRAGREREQLRQDVAQAVDDRDRPVGAADPDVDVQAEGVVAPDDVAEQLVVAAIVGVSMIRCSCQGDQGCVPVAPSASPIGS